MWTHVSSDSVAQMKGHLTSERQGRGRAWTASQILGAFNGAAVQAAATTAAAAVFRAVKEKDKQLSGRAVIYSHLHLVPWPHFYAAEWLVDFLFFSLPM